MAYETILYEKRGPVVTLTLNRPETINAINPQMTAELHGALDEADADAEARAIILTGAGRGFSAGFDIARRPDGRSSLDATGVEVGEYIKRWWARDRDSVTEGQPLVGVVDLSRLELEVWVPESYGPDIKPGTPAVLTIEGREWPGEVTSLSPEVQGSRVRGIVGFKGEMPAGLKQNQRVSATLVLETRRNVLKVARGPFLEALGERGAYVVDDDVAELRPIEVGSVSVSEVEIAGGLQAGDQIVLSDPSPFQGAKRVLLQR